MKKILISLFTVLVTTSATAEVVSSITLNSDNRIRGISQNQANPGIVLNAQKTFNNGFYAGTTIPTVSGSLGYGFHIDPYAGYKLKLFDLITVDVGTQQYLFPKVTKYSTSEIYANLSLGYLTFKTNRSLSEYFSYPNSVGTTYYEINLTYPVNDKISVYALVGRLNMVNNEFFNYDTYQTGVNYRYSKEWGFSARYIENKKLTDIAKQFGYVENGRALWKDTLIISIQRFF